MLHIEEQTLTVLLLARSVTHFELRETSSGFGVFVGIDAGGDEGLQTAMLITARMKHQPKKSPRSWVSVDKFIQHLKAKIPTPPEVRIYFNKEGTSSKRKRAPPAAQQHP